MILILSYIPLLLFHKVCSSWWIPRLHCKCQATLLTLLLQQYIVLSSFSADCEFGRCVGVQAGVYSICRKIASKLCKLVLWHWILLLYVENCKGLSIPNAILTHLSPYTIPRIRQKGKTSKGRLLLSFVFFWSLLEINFSNRYQYSLSNSAPQLVNWRIF